MTPTGARPGSSPLDDFLAGDDSGSAAGEWLETVGSLGTLVGVTASIGLIALLARVHRGPVVEVRRLLRVVTALGLLAVAGASAEFVGAKLVGDLAWSDVLGSANGASIMMRLVGGILIAFGLYPETRSTEGDESTDVRWLPGAASAFGLVGVIIAAMSFAFDGHAVSQGPRVVHALTNMVHVVSGGVWFGGVLGLALIAVSRHRHGVGGTGALVVRFSGAATVTLIVVALAGVGMTLVIADDVSTITSSPWGHRLIVKTSAVAIAVAIGAFNHFRLVPALDAADGPSDATERTMRRSLCGEGAVLAFVVAVTALLVTASPT